MEKILTENPSLKRLMVALATGATIALNKKWNLGLDTTDIIALTTFALGYIAQSGLNSAAKAKAAGVAAAANVKTPADADAVLK